MCSSGGRARASCNLFFERSFRLTAPSTGSFKMMGGAYAGDWLCPSCDATVFASKNNCFKCQTPRPAGAGGGGGGGGGGYGKCLSRVRERTSFESHLVRSV